MTQSANELHGSWQVRIRIVMTEEKKNKLHVEGDIIQCLFTCCPLSSQTTQGNVMVVPLKQASKDWTGVMCVKFRFKR